MEGFSVCTPQLAESDANTASSSPSAASLTDGDNSINTKIKSAQTEGSLRDEELLKGLCEDDYCHVCEAVLRVDPQRHYQGKKHDYRLKAYLLSKRAQGPVSGASVGRKNDVPMDRDHFCDLCNMMFSSAVVAVSHYKGKLHGKNLHRHRSKQVLNQPGLPTHSGQMQASHKTETVKQKSAMTAAMDLQEPTVCTAAGSWQDLKDPNYCALCAAPFNNPQMALQHYNGRKHQRNQARQRVLQDLGEDSQQGAAESMRAATKASCLVCQVCNAKFNSVEMYQAHMQGTKHQVKEKMVIDLCKSQQKDYGSFADELADYIQVQKARGINTPASGHPPPQGAQQKDGEDKEVAPRNSSHHKTYVLNRPPVPSPQSSNALSGPTHPAAGWCPPPYQSGSSAHAHPHAHPPPHIQPHPHAHPHLHAHLHPRTHSHPHALHPPHTHSHPPPLPPPHGHPPHPHAHSHAHPPHSFSGLSGSWDHSFPHPVVFPRTGALQPPNPNRPGVRKRHSEQSSSSSYSSSSLSSSSSSSYSSDSEEEKRKGRRHRSGRERRVLERDSDKEVWRAQRQKRARRDRSQERRRRRGGGEGGDSHMGSRRKARRDPVRRRRQEKRPEESVEGKAAEEAVVAVKDMKAGETHTEAQINPVQAESHTAKPLKPKPRKEKKKQREVEDKRTEEEKLWDESILGL